MRRFVLLLTSMLLCSTAILAQSLESGYYRVYNHGTGRYIYVTDNTGSYSISANAGDFAALQLWKGAERTIADPASVIYVKKVDSDNYDLQGQNTGIYALVSRYVNIKLVTSGALKGTYTVGATERGITKYLSDNELANMEKGALGTDGNSPYRNWNAVPVSSSSDNYLGVKANVQVGGKYYYPLYTAFPYTLASGGMKAYTITKVNLGMAVYKELTGMIPAFTPVIIECNSASPSDNRLELTVSSQAAPADNIMKGVFFCNNKRQNSKDAITKFDGNTMRVLGVTADGKLGFVSASENLQVFDNVSYLPANQAYLPVEDGSDAEITIVTEQEYNEIAANHEYSLTYTVDGEVYEVQKLKAGEKITPLEAPEREGYTFSGWSEIPETMPESDFTVKGTFTINSYTLIYMLDGEVFKTEKWDYHAAITPAEAPKREGYTFNGWEGLSRSMPAHDVTVTGSYTINTYTLTYMVDGAVYKTFSVQYGTELNPLEAPEREGYTFSGWSEIPATMPAGDYTVQGTFTVNSYTIIYILDGEEFARQTVEYGTTITPPELPEREGYTFSGWSGLPEKMPAGDVTATGSYTVNSYVLTYMVDGQEYKTQTYEYGATVTPLEDPVKEGYAFSGWSEVPETMPAHDVTVKGTFSICSYTLTYILNGAGYEDYVYRTYTYKYGESLTALTTYPTKSGYEFSGWEKVPATMPAHDVVIKGTYTPQNFTITYMIDNEVYRKDVVPYGSAVPAFDNPEREGYTFNGWIGVPETMPARNVTVYGSFTVNSYTLTYILNGAGYDNTVYRKVVYPFGTTIVPLNVPSQNGYNFSGWKDLPATMPAHDVTVYGSYDIVGISDVKAAEEIQEVYDMTGRKLRAVQGKGLYIINGKKVFIK